MPASSLVADFRRSDSRTQADTTQVGNSALSARRIHLTLGCVGILLCSSGCASATYRYGRFHPGEPDGVALQPVVVERGRPQKTLDRFAWFVGLPERVMTLNSKTSNHHVSSETIEKLRIYLEQNDLTDVYVAVNDYDPKGQWRRLRENDRIAPFWRYSVGTISWLSYSMFPYRVFGGDEYNPFTNSLNLTSDVPALVLAEAAYAKDVHTRRHPGAYATFCDLPLLSMWRQARATSDVLGYARVQQDWDAEKQAYHVLYPHIGSTTFGPGAHFFPVAGPFLAAGGALVGHATGRTVTAVLQPKFINSPSGDPPLSPTESEAEEVAANTSRPTPRQSLPGDQAVVQAGFQESRATAPADASRKAPKPAPSDSSVGMPDSTARSQ